MAKPRIVIPVRLSYTYVAEPRPDDEKTDDDGNPLYYYSTQGLFPKIDKATYKKLQQAVQMAIANKFGKEKVRALMANDRFKKPLRDADAEDRDGAEYKGHWFFNCKTNARFNNAKDLDTEDKTAEPYAARPGLVLKNRKKLTSVSEIHRNIYSGCYVYLSVTAYYFKTKSAQGIALALNNIMKDKDGERLDGSMDAEDEFADLFEEDDGMLDDFDDLGGQSGSDNDLGLDDDWDI